MKLAIDNTFAARSVVRRRNAPSLPAEPAFKCDGGRAAWNQWFDILIVSTLFA